MSPAIPERRTPGDRRHRPRGGRRPTDRDGHTPLVLVADDNAETAGWAEAILAKLHFAVAPVKSVEEALRVMHGLRPEIVVARLAEADRLRKAMLSDATTAGVPFITIPGDAGDPEAMVEAIRRVLRERRASGVES